MNEEIEGRENEAEKECGRQEDMRELERDLANGCLRRTTCGQSRGVPRIGGWGDAVTAPPGRLLNQSLSIDRI